MSYDISDFEMWQWAEDATFGATTVTHNVMGPRGKVGYVRDIIVDVTTALVGTTTVPEVLVGISSGDATFGRYRLGTTVSNGYATGMHRASMELITGNPPRVATDFASHVILDGGPLTSQGVAGGTYGTVVPSGRMVAGPYLVTNDISGTGSVHRVSITGNTAAPGGLSVGQKVLIQGISGATSINGLQAISAIASDYSWIELTGTTFGGTYTSGGLVVPQFVVTCKAGVGGSPAGGGIVRVKTEWQGAHTP